MPRVRLRERGSRDWARNEGAGRPRQVVSQVVNPPAGSMRDPGRRIANPPQIDILPHFLVSVPATLAAQPRILPLDRRLVTRHNPDVARIRRTLAALRRQRRVRRLSAFPELWRVRWEETAP